MGLALFCSRPWNPDILTNGFSPLSHLGKETVFTREIRPKRAGVPEACVRHPRADARQGLLASIEESGSGSSNVSACQLSGLVSGRRGAATTRPFRALRATPETHVPVPRTYGSLLAVRSPPQQAPFAGSHRVLALRTAVERGVLETARVAPRVHPGGDTLGPTLSQHCGTKGKFGKK